MVSHDCHSYLHITQANGIPPREAMVMAGENAANDVDEEVYGNDGADRHEAPEASAGDRRAIADADQAGQLDISGETKNARILRTPEPPTDAARMAHNATHVPYRDWCPICVASRGRSSPHSRVIVNKTADTLPKFQTDYTFIRTVAESKTQPCITFVETRSGVVISFMCARKGGSEDLTKEILRHFEAYGFLNPSHSVPRSLRNFASSVEGPDMWNQVLDNALREPVCRWVTEGVGFMLARDYRKAQKRRRGSSGDAVKDESGAPSSMLGG